MKSEQVYQKLQWEYGLCEIKAAIETQITSKSQQKQVSYEIKIVINHGVSKKSHKKNQCVESLLIILFLFFLSLFRFLCFSSNTFFVFFTNEGRDLYREKRSQRRTKKSKGRQERRSPSAALWRPRHGRSRDGLPVVTPHFTPKKN